MEEQTKMENISATRYIPMQKRAECQPPMAESVDLDFIGFYLSFSRVPSGRKNTTNRSL